MKHRDKLYLAGILALVSLSAWGLTKMTSVQMVNSTIDSTPIGQTTPAAGSFTSVTTGAPSVYIGDQNIGINRRTSDGYIYNTGGFGYQFQHFPSTTPVSDSLCNEVFQPNGTPVTLQALCINGAGNVNAQGEFSAASIYAGGVPPSYSQGSYFGWDYNSGTGETDFFNDRGSGSGGFYFWTLPGSSSSPTAIAHLDQSGNMTAASFIGPLSGNATTATALAANPSNCTSGEFATGISANGTAEGCANPNPSFTGGSGYQTLGSGLIFEWVNTGVLNNNTPTTVSIPHTLTHALYSVTCSDNGSRVQGGNVQAVGANTSGLSAPFSYFYASTPATGVSAYCTVIGY